MLTENEIERVRYMWIHEPCYFDEIVRDINQFRKEPVSEEEIWEALDSLIHF